MSDAMLERAIELEDECFDLRRENERLRAALEAAQEALFWHDGMAFEYKGQIVGQQIVNVLAKTKG